MLELLQDIYNDYDVFHSPYQIENFIIGTQSNTNAYARFKQARNEVFSRYKTLKDYYLKIMQLELDIEEKGKTTIGKENKLAIYKIQSEIEDIVKQLESLQKEFVQLVNIMFSYKAILPDKSYEELDREMWIDLTLESIAKDFIIAKQLGQKSIDLVFALNPDDQINVLEIMQNKEKVLNWYANKKEELMKIKIEDYSEGNIMLQEIPKELPNLG